MISPTWQRAAIASYFANVTTNTGKSPVSGYSTTGRGYPDVAGIAVNYQTVVDAGER